MASAWPGFPVAGLGAMVRPMVRMARPMMRPMARMARPMFKMAGKLMAAAKAKAKAAGLCSGEACTPEEIARWLPFILSWINDAGYRSFYSGLTMLATVHTIVLRQGVHSGGDREGGPQQSNRRYWATSKFCALEIARWL